MVARGVEVLVRPAMTVGWRRRTRADGWSVSAQQASRWGAVPASAGMIGPADPSATLVLRGDGEGGRGQYVAQLICGTVTLATALGYFAFVLALTAGTDEFGSNLGFAIFETALFLVVPIMIFGQALAHRHRVRRLAGTEVWVSPRGVAYVCAAGCFGVPWPAVRWIGFRGRGAGFLCVEARGWTGPVSRLGAWWRGTRTLQIRLDGIDRAAVAQTIHAATGVSVAVPPG